MGKFNLSKYHLTTADMGLLIPVQWREVLMGDTFRGETTMFARVSPLVSPLMHPVFVRFHHWYVPNRLIWNDFEEFITGGETGEFVAIPPRITVEDSDVAVGSLGNYFGLPPSSVGKKVSALPFRAYAKIWNEFYRDQDLQTELEISEDSGDDTITSRTIQNVSWRKDRFTIARPWTQLGSEVTIPVNSNSSTISRLGYIAYSADSFTINVTDFSTVVSSLPSSATLVFECVDNGGDMNSSSLYVDTISSANTFVYYYVTSIYKSQTDSHVETITSLSVALTNVVELSVQSTPYSVNISYSGLSCSNASTIAKNDIVVSPVVFNVGSKDIQELGNIDVLDLRAALALQRFKERRAKYGHKYIDYLMFHHITPSDARLQLPEYIGGGKNVLQISEVVQTATIDDTSKLGDLGGRGVALAKTNRFKRFFEEHGIFMTLMSIVPAPVYGDRLDASWSRQTKEEYWQQEFQHIGQEEVFSKEVYAGASDDLVFGYNDRYDTYRYAENEISGGFRESSMQASYTLARMFNTTPYLNSDFIKCNPDKSRVLAYSADPFLICMIRNSLRAHRLVAQSAKTITI